MKERFLHILNSLSNFLMPVDAYWLSLDTYSVLIPISKQLISNFLCMSLKKNNYGHFYLSKIVNYVTYMKVKLDFSH